MTVFEWASKHGISPQALGELLAVLDPDRGGRPDRVPAGSMKSEAAVQAALQIEAAKRGGVLWRNNSGACVAADGRQVRYGLANTSAKINEHFKSSDLIGIGPGGRFMAVEVKEPGWRKPTTERETAQNNFLNVVRALGGIGLFAQSVGDVFP
jgi:hypothetical protein